MWPPESSHFDSGRPQITPDAGLMAFILSVDDDEERRLKYVVRDWKGSKLTTATAYDVFPAEAESESAERTCEVKPKSLISLPKFSVIVE